MEGRSAFANLKDSKSFLLVALLILIGQYLIVTFGGEMFSVIPLSLERLGDHYRIFLSGFMDR